MVKKDVSRQVSTNDPDAAIRTNKGQQGIRKDQKDLEIPNQHLEHQDRHGGGEGETGMQPGAGHPRGR